MGAGPVPIASLDADGLRDAVVARGHPASHADRIAAHVLRRGVLRFEDVPGLGPRVAAPSPRR
jgi:hypothetical protein